MLRKIILAAALAISTFIQGNAAEITDGQKAQLAQQAALARQNAYAPYSKFFVGAALLTDDGKIYQGCNVENASYGLACCAERTAIFKAISEGARQIVAMAVVVPGGGTPCGACRQVLNEFNPEMLIIFGNEEGFQTGEISLSQLIPNAFGPHNLNK